MTTLIIKKIIELGGKEWKKDDMQRVYLSFKLINLITDDMVCGLTNRDWKFYIDVETGDIFRRKYKAPMFVANISKFETNIAAL